MKYLNRSIFLLYASALFTLSSCGSEADPAEIAAENELLLQDFFAANNLSPQKTASGMYYIIEESGSSNMPTRSSTVTVHYHGYYLDGQVFDSSVDRGEPAVFSLRRTIDGFREGIPLFGVGGKGSLFIPSQLAYGEEGSTGGIPGRTPIAFDVELIEFN